MKIKLLMFVMLLSMVAFPQKNNLDKMMESLEVAETDFQDFEYGMYPANCYIKSDLLNFEKADFSTPEGLIQSIISENSLEWININYLKKKDSLSVKENESLKKKKLKNNNNNYPQLIQKISFIYKGNKACLVKFCFHSDETEKLPIGFYFMVYKNGRWYRDTSYIDNDLLTIVFRMYCYSSSKLNDLFKKGNGDNSELMKGLVDKVFTGDKFSIDAFSKDMNEWEYKKESEKYKYFRENLEWIK